MTTELGWGFSALLVCCWTQIFTICSVSVFWLYRTQNNPVNSSVGTFSVNLREVTDKLDLGEFLSLDADDWPSGVYSSPSATPITPKDLFLLLLCLFNLESEKHRFLAAPGQNATVCLCLIFFSYITLVTEVKIKLLRTATCWILNTYTSFITLWPKNADFCSYSYY